MTAITHVLIFTSGRRLSDSLQVLLKSNNPLTIVELTDQLDAALQLLVDNPPTLVLIDAALPDGAAWQALEYIQQHCPQHHCLVLAHFPEHQKRAQDLKAQTVMLYSFTVKSLYDALDQMI